MDAIEKLLAIEEIKKLKARYFRALDFKRWTEYGELFTEDAPIDFSAQPDLWNHGPEEDRADPKDWILIGGVTTAEMIEPLFEQVVSVHHGHDPEIDLDGPDFATGVWSLYDRLEFPTEVFHGYGHYHDEYRLVDGRWLISRLTLTRLRGRWEPRPEEG